MSIQCDTYINSYNLHQCNPNPVTQVALYDVTHCKAYIQVYMQYMYIQRMMQIIMLHRGSAALKEKEAEHWTHDDHCGSHETRASSQMTALWLYKIIMMG